MLKKSEQILARIIDGAIALFFAAILLITILQVFLRYGLNSSILGGNEAMEALFIYTTALGAAVAVRRRMHININFLITLMPETGQKLTDILVHLLVLFLNGAMIYFSLDWISKVGGNESPVMRVPEWIMQISIPLGCALVICYCLVNIILNLQGEWPAKEDQAC